MMFSMVSVNISQRRLKYLSLVFVSFVVILVVYSTTAPYYFKHEDRKYFHGGKAAEPTTDVHESPLQSTATFDYQDDKLPVNLKKSNPSFHVFIRTSGSKPNAALCRTVLSSMVLNYPPPTLIGLGKPSQTNHVTDIDQFLSDENGIHKIRGTDVLLIIDENTWLQLPPDVMLQRFQSVLMKENERLRSVYDNGQVNGQKTMSQKYSQRIIFGAGKYCSHYKSNNNISCVAVPRSTLMPDIYGPKTDRSSDISFNRPRWLNSGAVIGTLADIMSLYKHAASVISGDKSDAPESQVLSQIFGEQELVRELYRRKSVSSWLTRLGERVGILDTINISNINFTVVPTKRYEYSIGLDYESQIFSHMSHSENDVEWLRYNDTKKLSSVQLEHHATRGSRINLPEDLASLQSPFTQHLYNDNLNPRPIYNDSIDKLPENTSLSWANIPLATNIFSKSIPPAVHATHSDQNNITTWWHYMWYHPWSRALLRRYIRSPGRSAAAVSSFFGGDSSWDTRGGEGGVWETNGKWSTWGELCQGFENEVFGDDGFGRWGFEEGKDADAPVYNEFGSHIAGKEPPSKK